LIGRKLPMLTDDDRKIIQEEEVALQLVRESLEKQLTAALNRRSVEEFRSRDLTAEYVASRRVEDKVQIATHERLSHALKDRHSDEKEQLEKLLKKPYFARVVLSEEVNRNGMTIDSEREFKVGYHANSDCRIIDWKRAPLSKLYYHYKEGEEYSEEILGTERNGVIRKRRLLDIVDGKLRRLACPQGIFEYRNNTWCRSDRGAAGHLQASSSLPDVLSLITPEQFNAITQGAESPVFIQGVAGSGKTTVALYRAAWLLNEHPELVQLSRAAVVMVNPLLSLYVKNSLAKLDLPALPVLTFTDWVSKLSGGEPLPAPSATGRRVKSSEAMLNRLTEELRTLVASGSMPTEIDIPSCARDLTLKILSDSRSFMQSDPTRLIGQPILKTVYEATKNGQPDSSDQLIALWVRLTLKRWSFTKKKHLPETSIGLPFDMLVIDEVQDLAPLEIATAAASVERQESLTFVGDTAQQIDSSSPFPGWSFVQQLSTGTSSTAAPLVQLTVNHRSTHPIMNFAAAIRNEPPSPSGRPGRTPIWFRCRRERIGVPLAIGWIQKAVVLYPGTLSAVLCPTRDSARAAYSLLKASMGALVNLADPQVFTADEGILIADIAMVKGLEFSNVLLWNPSKKLLSESSDARDLLYVAATRARENLCVVTWEAPSQYLPNFHSPVVRGYDRNDDDDAE
jgi:DNA helicase-2/ATP-dependent DNA helicase PcrA